MTERSRIYHSKAQASDINVYMDVHKERSNEQTDTEHNWCMLWEVVKTRLILLELKPCMGVGGRWH